MSKSELARKSGISRSVISGYLAKDPNLPTSLNLLHLAEALGVEASSLLMSSKDLAGPNTTASVFDNGPALSRSDEIQAFLERLTEHQGEYTYYLPKSLPEPLKTDVVLEAEYGAGANAALGRYRDHLKDVLNENLLGAMLIDESVLLNFIHRNPPYQGLSQQQVNAQLDVITEYSNRVFPMVQIQITNYTRHQLSPCTIIGDEMLACEFFDRIVTLGKSALLQHLLGRARHASQEATNFQMWSKTVLNASAA